MQNKANENQALRKTFNENQQNQLQNLHNPVFIDKYYLYYYDNQASDNANMKNNMYFSSDKKNSNI